MGVEVSKDILQYEMYNADVFSEEQKVSLNQVATLLTSAYTKCFTVSFTTKVDEKQVAEKLKDVKAKLTEARARELAKEVLTGKE